MKIRKTRLALLCVLTSFVAFGLVQTETLEGNDRPQASGRRGPRGSGGPPNQGGDSIPGSGPSGSYTEALAGFDQEGNGLVDTGTHAEDQAVFDEVEQIDEGLGPVFNAQSCRECHQNPISGALSQVTELRVGFGGRFGQFRDPDIPINNGSEVIAGRSLINDRTICPSPEFPNLSAQMLTPHGASVRTFRTSLNTLGDGYVEALDSGTLLKLAQEQCRRTNGEICGQAILVPVLEAPGQTRVGRFGWKNQHASLLSFSADAYLNEMGITSELLPDEVTKLCDAVADPEDEADGNGIADIDRFARFMRATKAPPRDDELSRTLDAQLGADLFDRIGCDTCHVSRHVTAPAGSVINGGTFEVPPALGDKIIHPFSDFLLHDVDTGDGIRQNGPANTTNKLRTPPLWGVRMRTRLMHDGLSLTFEDAIRRHGGEAWRSRERFHRLSDQEKQQVITFLKSL